MNYLGWITSHYNELDTYKHFVTYSIGECCISMKGIFQSLKNNNKNNNPINSNHWKQLL